MAKFCRYCGKEALNGVCDCAASQQEREMTGAVAPESQNTNWQQTNDAGWQQMQYQKPQRNIMEEIKQLVLGMVKTPLKTMADALEVKDPTALYAIGGAHLFVLLLIGLIRFNIGSIEIPVTGMKLADLGIETPFFDRFKVGLFLILIVAGANLIVAAVTKYFASKNNENIDFKKIVQVMINVTMVQTVGYFVACILSFISGGTALVVIMIVGAIWSVLVYEAVLVCTKADRNKAIWYAVAAMAAALVIVGLIGGMIAKSALESWVSELVGEMIGSSLGRYGSYLY